MDPAVIKELFFRFMLKNEQSTDINETEVFIKNAVKELYYDFRDNGEGVSKVKCSKELIEKMKNNPELFRLNKDIDSINIPFASICDFSEDEEKPLMKVKVSMIFYDNTQNNEQRGYSGDNYWNDTWIIYLTLDLSRKESTCNKCGASMNFDEEKDMLECKYCGNKVYNAVMNKWKFEDIEVEK